MPEKGDKYFHIPVRSNKLFQKGSFKTIKIESGVLAVIGKPKGSSKTTIQKFMLSVKKFKTLEKAKAWVRSHMKGKKKSGFITDDIELKSLYGGNRLSWGAVFKSINDEERTIELEASDDSIDVVRDRVMPDAQHDIIKGINSGYSTIFLNHNWLNGIGKILEKHTDGTKTYLKVYVSETEPETWTKIKEGVLKGASIAFQPTKVKYQFYEELGFDVREIHGLQYLETSLTYLPANKNAGIRVIGD